MKMLLASYVMQQAGKSHASPVSSSFVNEHRWAFVRGDVDKIQRLINSKADVNKGDYDLRTAIHLVMTSP